MQQSSPYQRVITYNGDECILHAPRYMHAMDGKYLKGDIVDPETGQIGDSVYVVPVVNIASNIAVKWTGDHFMDAPEMLVWSEQ